MSDIYTENFDGLVTIHRAIEGALAGVVDVPTARGAGGFLLAHHDAESHVLFPGLRRYGRLRSTDVAFLDACDRAHRELHTLCEHLLAATDPGAIALLAGDTLALLRAHVAEEEVGLAPARTREMVTPDEFAAIGREIEALRARR
jgi:hypothetical protein